MNNVRLLLIAIISAVDLKTKKEKTQQCVQEEICVKASRFPENVSTLYDELWQAFEC